MEDASHVRNAIARFDQVKDVTDAERDAAWKRIKRAASKFGVAVNDESWRELGKGKSSTNQRNVADTSKAPRIGKSSDLG